MFRKLAFVLVLASGLIHQAANATPCGGEHEVLPGDSLSFLASLGPHYSNAAYWDVLFEANRDRIGDDPNLIYPGVMLRIPCLDEDGNLIPGQFDADGNPIPEAFDGSGRVVAAYKAQNQDAALMNEDAEHDHSAHGHTGDTASEQTAETEESTQPAASESTETQDTAESTETQDTAESTETQDTAEQTTEVAAAAPAETAAGSLRLLTGDDYGLSADRSISNGRVVSKIIDAALNEDGETNHKISWINDWSAHLDPLLSTHSFDVGFPWVKPDCAANATDQRCTDFLFTDPVFEVWMLLFTNAEAPVAFDNDSDLEGKKFCRPSGYPTDDLDANGRNWVAEGKITLEQPASVQQCFRMLMNKQVDGVIVNEFAGRSVLKSLNIADKVTVVDAKPVSIQNLYALVHKDHPQAMNILDEINAGIQAIQASGTYQQILTSNK